MKLNFSGYSAVCFLILFFPLHSLCLSHVHECETVFSLLQRTTLKKRGSFFRTLSTSVQNGDRETIEVFYSKVVL